MSTSLQPGVKNLFRKMKAAEKNTVGSIFFQSLMNGGLLLTAFAVPLLFLPLTTDATEIHKQILFLILLGISLVGWLGCAISEGRFGLRRSPMYILAAAYLAVYAISTALSANVATSFLGDVGLEKSALVSVGGFVALMVLAGNAFREQIGYGRLLVSSTASALIIALFSLIQGFGARFWPFTLVSATAFNPVGTPAALGIFLAANIMICGGLLLSHESKRENSWAERSIKVLLYVSSALSFLHIVALDFWPVNVALLVGGAALLSFSFIHADKLGKLGGVSVPVIAVTVALLLMILRVPSVIRYPTEVFPTLSSSASITGATLKKHPFFGSGPGTFVYDFALHRSAESNNSEFWYLNFDRSSSRLLTHLVTVGTLATLVLLVIIAITLISALRKLATAKDEDWHMLLAVFSAWIVLLTAKIVYSSSFVLEMSFWLMLGLIIGLTSKRLKEVSFATSPRAGMVFSFVTVLVAIASLAGYGALAQRYVSAMAGAQALASDAAGQPAAISISHLLRAAALRPNQDLTWRNLAAAHIGQMREELNRPLGPKGPQESDDDYRKRTAAFQQQQIGVISGIAEQAIAAARRATELSPENFANWQAFGVVYSSITGIANGAPSLAIENLEKARQLQPTNPAIVTEIGKAQVADAAEKGRLAEAEKDEAKKKTLEEESVAQYEAAAKSFENAIVLKNDYAQAHYQLALLLDQQGKVKDAIQKMEAAISYENTDAGLGLQLALLYFRDERKDEAQELLERIVAAYPQFANARWYLASIYEEKGELQKAVEQLKIVAELNPRNKDVAERLAKLGQGESDELPEPLEGDEEPSLQGR